MPIPEHKPPSAKAAASLPEATDGVLIQQPRRWGQFYNFIESMLANPQEYIWRGHRRSDWKLEPTIDRLARKASPTPKDIRRALLGRFRETVVGRRGINPQKLEDDELWALGQHFGLATPLLDWTRSPFAAAFFAFEDDTDSTKDRVVFGLHRPAIERMNAHIAAGSDLIEDRPPFLEILLPLVDENARLVSQGGYFTRAPENVAVEEWVSQQYQDNTQPILVRLELPSSERLAALRSLNRMNINHASLFPDLEGAARYVNLSHVIADY